MTDRSLDRLERAQHALERFLARRDAGEALTLEGLIAEHPELETELRELHAVFDQVPAALAAEARDRAATGAQAEALLTDFTGTDFTARYAIDGEIGKGGMGAVYRVVDRKLDRPLAMKVILGQTAPTVTGNTPPVPPHELARFLNEAKITSQLDHPGIVPVHEVGVDGAGRAYFTMKLVKGRSLREIIEMADRGEEGWNQTRVLGVVQRIFEAVAYAHDKGVIHRDLKPANVMVGRYGEAYVMDWGLARVLGEDDRRDLRLRSDSASLTSIHTLKPDASDSDSPLVTMDGAVVGTPAYMSPEQARGELDQVGPRSDVYSLGAMLYHAITGHAPYVAPGSKPSARTILARLLDGPPRRIEELAPRTPAELVSICEKAMQREAAERYPNVAEFAADLRAYLERRVVRAYESGTWAETKKWVQRNKALAGALAGGVLVLVAGIVISTMKTREAQEARHETESKNTELLAANTTIEAKRSELESKNVALGAATKAAQESSRQAQLARDEATQKANDVLSLSAQKDLDDLVAEAATLWPAHPEMLPRYEDWLRRAHELIDGRAADEKKGLKKRPSLAEHKAKLAELRRDAKPPTEAQIRADREAHPRFAELVAKQAELTWRSRMLGLEPWPSEAAVEAELAQEALPSEANALNELAWPLVDTDPAKVVYGRELRGLLLARRALAAASEEQRSGIRDTLAWALFRMGRFDEALAEERTARAEPGGDVLKSSAARLETSVGSWRGESMAKQREERETLAAAVALLTSEVSDRRTFEFADAEKAWWNRSLSKLIADLESLRDPKTGLMNDVLAEPFGWGVAKRYEFAKTIRARSLDGPEPKRLWAEAIAAIQVSPKYGGLVLTPQLGLLPIGMYPDSELWEFAHLQTGDPAVRGADGKLVLTEETGLVFVLIPGGTCWMGAQQTDSNGRNYYPLARGDEGPVHEVELSAYFLSKFEMTQGQWKRIAAVDPSYSHPPGEQLPLLLRPVEQVSWPQCFEMMTILKLSLPSEAQWELGARGGTSTPWWTGQAKESMVGKVNIADQSFVRAGGSTASAAELPDLDDGSVAHSTVGRYAPNGFGLHEVAGNVWEWCLDGYHSDTYVRIRGRDPISPWDGADFRVARGGSFGNDASSARSAFRFATSLEFRAAYVGLRPSRVITP